MEGAAFRKRAYMDVFTAGLEIPADYLGRRLRLVRNAVIQIHFKQ